MAKAATLPTTQRAYTLRLRGVDPNDGSWRDALWATHEAVNRGAKVFGDWLLTLRGGLDHKLADVGPPEQRKDRRILLALSWLSVEDAHGAPRDESLIVARGTDSTDCRARKLGDALTGILKARGVVDSELGDPNKRAEDQPGTWLGVCMPSLSAAIREDAVWVNRSAKFDEATGDWEIEEARKDAHTLLSFILKDEFLTLPTPKKATKNREDAGGDDEQEERQKAVKASSSGAGHKTRRVFGHVFASSTHIAKHAQSKLLLRDNWRKLLAPQFQEILRFQHLPIPRSGFPETELQREMFSKAASRVAQIVTKQRQQEADRLARKDADTDLQNMEADDSFKAALFALRTYCDEYRVTSGATGEFLIRPRQVTGWDQVVNRWHSIQESDPERAREARVEAVKVVQEADEEKKFDVNLFFRLAEDRFTTIWRHNGNADPSILERFVKGMKARSDSERLKIAAFRHPDPYRNPIFCQFGVSRPPIHFRRLKAFTNDPAGNDPRVVGMLLWRPASNSAKLTLLHGVSQRLDREIGAACDHVQQNTEELCAVSRRGRLGAAAGGLPNADSPARVAGVFDLKTIKSRTRDEQEDSDEDGNETGKLKVPKWNGTLSAGRRELAAIGKLFDKGDIQKANRRRKRLRWTLTISMEMEGRGPWFRYVAAAQDQTPFVRTARKDKPKDKNDAAKGLAERKGDKRIEPEGWPWQEFNRPLKDNTDGTALVEDTKAARGDKACLILSRLPGLRVLSVDLGHRFAASCAVWEALDARTFDMAKLIADAKAKEWRVEGSADGLFVHVHETPNEVTRNGRNKGKPVEKTTIYCRIGDDLLRDPKTGKPSTTRHPAPWARLDRQFFIKLQGEERPARAATNGKHKDGTPTETNEVAFVNKLVEDLGLLRDDADSARIRGVDELMRRAVRIVTLGLMRHARRAKIAYALDPNTKTILAIGGREKELVPGDDDHIKFLTNALFDWHALASESKWNDRPARDLWNEHIANLDGGWLIDDSKLADPQAGDSTTPAKRRKDEESLRHEKLEPIARNLVTLDRAAMHKAWKARWEKDDGDFAIVPKLEPGAKGPEKTKTTKDATGFHAHLRLITDWIMGRCLAGASSNGWKQNTGGLSLTRIATMRSLYQLHKAFAMRAKPEKPRGAPEKGESNAGVAQSILDAMERMREQRVKQIASRIVEAALGVGIQRDPVRDDVKKKWLYPKRPRELLCHVDDQGIEHGDPRFKPCHAVVIENLRNYRPDELQTRRENRALMNWSAGKVRKYLDEACQLHGLHLREIMPNYTSRQDSRTGLPGVRCVEVKVDAASGEPAVYWWKKRVAAARKKTDAENGAGKTADAESKFVVDLADHLARLKVEGKPLPSSVRIPCSGGDLFVAAPPSSCRDNAHSMCRFCDGRRVLHADLNAAANIGLRALMDPDFPGKWWYVPCDPTSRKPHPDKVRGGILDGVGPLQTVDAEPAATPRRARRRGINAAPREVVNLWRDPTTPMISGAAGGEAWHETPAYWNMTRARVIGLLREYSGLPTE